MEMADNISQEKKNSANQLISEIEVLLEDNENTKAAGRAEKLNKLFD